MENGEGIELFVIKFNFNALVKSRDQKVTETITEISE